MDIIITDILQSGQRLKLSNNKKYIISPNDIFTVANWISTQPVRITNSGNKLFPTTITNEATDESVLAVMFQNSKRRD